jgi:hypothetical protein
MIDLSALRPQLQNARRHSRAQIKQIAKSIEAWLHQPNPGQYELEILASHGRAAAALLIFGLGSIVVGFAWR